MMALSGLVSDQSLAAHGAVPEAQVVTSRLIYAAQNDGTIHVYDIDDQHAEVKIINVFTCCGDVRGITAAAPTHRVYVMYVQNKQGHVAALDVLSEHVVWDRVLHTPGVDRGDVTPDGRTLYVPTGEEDLTSPYQLVVDADTGTELARIALPARSHDTIVSLDGQHVFMETKSQTAAMYVADTTSNQVTLTLGGFCCSGVLAPFSINGTATRAVNDVSGLAGFQVADLATGGVVQSVPFTSGQGGHGIAWSPDEREVWVNDGALPAVHVFDMTVDLPAELSVVPVPQISHWITFNLDGRFAYVSGRKGSDDVTEIIDTTTRQQVGSLAPSEDLLELDFAAGSPFAVGNQFGIGRVTSPVT
jgi:DNA-binding beta-propeller fold protein YncE